MGFQFLMERGENISPSDKMLQRTDAEGKWGAQKSQSSVVGTRLGTLSNVAELSPSPKVLPTRITVASRY
jgi:hypothetical protein